MRKRLTIRIMVPLLIVAVAASVAWLRSRSAHHGATTAPHVASSGTLTLVQQGWGTPNSNSGLVTNALLDYGPDANFFPELTAQVPSVANGGIKMVSGDEVITYHLKPNLRWSDDSPITAADYIAVLLEALSPEAPGSSILALLSNLPPGNAPEPGNYCPLRRATMSGSTLVITLRGVLPDALDACGFGPVPWEYLQRKYGIPLPSGLTGAFEAGAVQMMYAGHAYQGSPLQRLIVKQLNDPYMSPKDLFSGPYRVVSWLQNGPDVLEPNPYYTAMPPDPHHPRPARIRLLAPANWQDVERSVLAGKPPASADLISLGGDPNSMPHGILRSYPPFHLNFYPTIWGIAHLSLNQASPALRDQRVRQALQYAIDKIEYVRELFNLDSAQAAAVALTSPFGHASRYSIAADFPPNLYNPAKARALLASAGYATSPTAPGKHLHLDLYSTTLPVRERGDAILQRMWRQVGIEVHLHFVNARGNGGLFGSYSNAGILARGDYDIAEMGYGFNRDPSLIFYWNYDPGQIPNMNYPEGGNTGRVRDPVLSSLLGRSRHTVDERELRTIYARFQREMVDRAYAISLWDLPAFIWVKPTFGNYNEYGGYTYFPWNAYQWYVR